MRPFHKLPFHKFMPLWAILIAHNPKSPRLVLGVA
jgi:hypothetical protein